MTHEGLDSDFHLNDEAGDVAQVLVMLRIDHPSPVQAELHYLTADVI